MNEPRKGYMVAGLESDLILDIAGQEVKLALCFAEGMIGALPVFDTEENAKAFAPEGVPVFSLELQENEEQDNATNL